MPLYPHFALSNISLQCQFILPLHCFSIAITTRPYSFQSEHPNPSIHFKSHALPIIPPSFYPSLHHHPTQMLIYFWHPGVHTLTKISIAPPPNALIDQWCTVHCKLITFDHPRQTTPPSANFTTTPVEIPAFTQQLVSMREICYK